MKRDNAIKLIRALQLDCESQHNRLDQDNDVAWDCYDKDNWKYFVKSLERVADFLESQTDDEDPIIWGC